MAGLRGFPIKPFSKMNPAATGVPPTFDAATLNEVLEGSGISLPEHLAQPGPFENIGGFFGRHPGLATGLDNALIAVAGMGPPGMSAGENISNAARGILGVQPYRMQHMAQQFMAPLAAASQVGQLRAQQASMDMYRAMGDYYRKSGQARLDAPEARIAAAQIHATLAGKSELGVGPDGKPIVMQRRWDEATNRMVLEPTNLDPRPLLHDRHSQRFGGGNSQQGAYITNYLADKFYGNDLSRIPDVVPQAQLNSALDDYKKHAVTIPLVGAAAGRGDLPPTQQTQYEAWKQGQQRATSGILYQNLPRDQREALLDKRTMELVKSGFGTTRQAQAKAEQEMQSHDMTVRGFLGDFWSLPYNDQLTSGGTMPYLRSRGYNPEQRSFSQPATSPQPNPVGASPPGVIAPGQQQQPSAFSPAVQAIIESLKKQ